MKVLVSIGRRFKSENIVIYFLKILYRHAYIYDKNKETIDRRLIFFECVSLSFLLLYFLLFKIINYYVTRLYSSCDKSNINQLLNALINFLIRTVYLC